MQKQGGTAPPSWPIGRQHPRVPLDALAEIESRAAGVSGFGRIENISLGGLRILWRATLGSKIPLVVRFKLPGGRRLKLPGLVVYAQEGAAQAGAAMGVQFLSLKEQERQAIAEFVGQAHAKPFGAMD